MATRDLTDLADDIVAIRKAHAAVIRSGKRFISDVAELGKLFEQVKSKLGHGRWGPWLRQHFDYISLSTVEHYRLIYRVSLRPEFEAASEHLPLVVLYELARRSMGADADALLADDVQNLLAQKRAGQPVTAATVRELRRERLQPPSQPLGPMMVVRTEEPSQPRDSRNGMTVVVTTEQLPPTSTHAVMLNPRPSSGGAAGRVARCVCDLAAAAEQLTGAELAVIAEAGEVTIEEASPRAIC